MIYLIGIFVLYLYFRYIGPIVIRFKLCNDSTLPTKVVGRVACYNLYSSDDDKTIQVGDWKEIQTDVSFNTVKGLGGRAIEGRITVSKEFAQRKGVRNNNTVFTSNQQISVIIFNRYKYPIRIRRGDKIAQIEFNRVSEVVNI